MKKSIAIIGSGNLGKSIAQGLLKNEDFEPSQLILTRRNPANLSEFTSRGVTISSDNRLAAEKADILILGVKPFTIPVILDEIKDILESKKIILISLATGVSLNEIAQQTNSSQVIFRAMPNIAADIQESITCLCSRNETVDQKTEVENLFNHIGQSSSSDESLMEAATGLGACGIAYVLRFIRAMIQGGIQIGFDSDTASKIVNQTVKGAAELMIKNEMHPEEAIDKVTTPKGCTIVGLNEMEHHGFSSSMVRGGLASYEKIEK